MPTRPTVAVINLRALARNLKEIRTRVGSTVKVMAVVKANAYGHGIAEVARFLQQKRVDCFGVANAEEGVVLREAGIRLPVHVFTIPSGTQIPLIISARLQPTIGSEHEARLLNAAAQRAGKTVSAHLKVDTGMNRIGVKPDHIAPLVRVLKNLKRLEIVGVYSHFATADSPDRTFALQQLDRFHGALDTLWALGIQPDVVHCAGSAGILNVPEATFDMVRPGIMLYGYYPSPDTPRTVHVEPVLSLKSRVSVVKWISAGESVSYGRRFIARRRTRIATLPLGYADGYMRLLTGRSTVLIGGREFPIVGTICMDQLMVDVGTSDVRPGDEAVLIGHQGRKNITAWDLASRIGTIPYEICTNISSRVPRIVG
ncbi:MAG TPA: alanine racemase [Bacteroidota bacterium]|nr:alanine racemase [Bacteroidota bacterium]